MIHTVPLETHLPISEKDAREPPILVVPHPALADTTAPSAASSPRGRSSSGSSSSLSALPDPSRQSTPLSEPPDEDDHKSPSAPASPPKSPHPRKDVPEHPPSPVPRDALRTPAVPETAVSAVGDPKVVAILELNAELLKVCQEFQKRSVALSESNCQAYYARLESNLHWLAASADEKQRTDPLKPLPMMTPPPKIDFIETGRIQGIYTTLPVLFQKDTARRMASKTGTSPESVNAPKPPSPPSLKRDRPDEDSSQDTANKRRDTGETKTTVSPPSTNSVPPPTAPASSTTPAPSSTPSVNGIVPNPAAQYTPPSNTSQRTSPTTSAAEPPKPPQTPMQTHQQPMQGNMPRHMSPPGPSHNPGQGPMPGMPQQQHPNNMNITNVTPDAVKSLPQQAQQVVHVLRIPQHPMTQAMNQVAPGWQNLPLPTMFQKFGQLQNYRMRHQQQQQQQQMANQQNPAAQQQQHHPQHPQQQGFAGNPMSPPQPQQSPTQMFANNPNPMNPMPGQGGPGQPGMGGMPGMNMGNMNMGMSGMNNMQNMTPQQRQQLMLMQQSRNASGTPNPMMQNQQQQMMYAQQQERMQQQQQQQRMMGQQQQHHPQAGPGGSPTNPNSPPGHGPDGFGGMRPPPNPGSANAIPGIARSQRSPTEAMAPPMTPRMGGATPRPTPGPGPQGQQGMSQDEFHRAAMMQQQQARAMQSASPPGFNAHHMGGAGGGGGGGWSPQQQQQGMHMGMGGGGQQQQPGGGMGGGGMHGMGAGSFPGNQGWNAGIQGGAGGGGFQNPAANPFAMPPQQQQQAQQPHMVMGGMPGGGGMNPMAMSTGGTAEFDMFNWNGT